MFLIMGHAQLSFAQNRPHIETSISYVTIEPKACVQTIWLRRSEIPRLVSRDGDTFGFTERSGPINYTQISKSNLDEFGDWTDHKFENDTRHLFEVELGLPTKIDGSILFDSGTLTIRNENGLLQVEEVKALLSCNSSGELSIIGFEDTSKDFKIPKWLKKPEGFQPQKRIVQPIEPVIVPLESSTLETKTESIIAPDQNSSALISAPDTLPPKELVPLYEIQLAAFRQEKKVLEHLNEVRNLASYINSYKLEIQTGKNKELGSVYRLRVTGVTDETTAITLCERLKNDGVDCYVPQRS